jgi:hypothetical protein
MKRVSFVFLMAVIVLGVPASTPLQSQRPGDSAFRRPPGLQREELERRFRERSAEIARRELQLNDDQMSRLRAVNRQFETQRLALFAEERRARQALRAELTAASPNQQKVAAITAPLRHPGERAEGIGEIPDAGAASEIFWLAESAASANGAGSGARRSTRRASPSDAAAGRQTRI